MHQLIGNQTDKHTYQFDFSYYFKAQKFPYVNYFYYLCSMKSIMDITLRATEIFEQLIWPEGPVCPVCGSHEHYNLKDGRFKCKHCRKSYSIKTNTIFEGSKLPIEFWLVGLYFIIQDRGCSAITLAKHLGITHKSAYYMMQRLRFAFDQRDIKLSDEVAMDEIYIGGNWSKMKLSKKQALMKKFSLPEPKNTREKIAVGNYVNSHTKKPVYGLTDGKFIVLQAISNPVTPDEIKSTFKEHIISTNTVAVSDSSTLYNNFEKETGCYNPQVNHSKNIYSVDGYSSNKIEGLFNHTRREIETPFVHMRRGYLQLYLNEYAFRYNTRHLSLEDKLKAAITKCKKKLDKDYLRQLRDTEDTLLRTNEFFDPEQFFSLYGTIIRSYTVGGITFKAEDYIR